MSTGGTDIEKKHGVGQQNTMVVLEVTVVPGEQNESEWLIP